MRILVYGAGVLGCELAHMLMKNKRNEVTLLARGEWKENIDKNGLVIRHWAQRKTTVDKVRTIAALAPEDVYDLVFVVMRACQLPAVLPALAANGSRYFVFVGNNACPDAVLAAMGGKAGQAAFGFQGTAGRREDGRVVSIHLKTNMTVGCAHGGMPQPLRLLLAQAVRGTGYSLTPYGNMDEWLKCHLAAVLPLCYVCYALGGDMTKATRAQISDALDASFEGCLMLKDAGVPVNDKENTDYYRPGTKARALMEAAYFAMVKTPIGRLCVSDHAMHAVDEMRFLNDGFDAVRAKTNTPMPKWDALRAAMPDWDELERKALG